MSKPPTVFRKRCIVFGIVFFFVRAGGGGLDCYKLSRKFFASRLLIGFQYSSVAVSLVFNCFDGQQGCFNDRVILIFYF